MDALVNSLMEELNCETVFTIPIEISPVLRDLITVIFCY